MNQFRINGYQLFRRDRSGGGIIFYIRDNIPAKQLNIYSLPNDIEAIIIEINLWKRKWLLCGSYNPHEGMISYHLQHISKLIDFYISKYDNFLLLGDYNCEVKETPMDNFLCSYNLKNLVKKPTCFKNVNNPRTIDLILTNKSKSFYHTDVLKTGLSDFHKMIVTVQKFTFVKANPKI